MIHIGFTGTRRGMTPQQRKRVRSILEQFESGQTAHHGDCVGADSDFHDLAHHAGHRITIHPPSNPEYRAHRQGFNVLCPVAEYMVRNRAIVKAADLMLATPADMKAQRRGGTWATIGMASEARKPLVICWPDGSTEWRNGALEMLPTKEVVK